jgi:lipid II:glycine glycyltransferase (peptidoglycan interpeptide bridge formation enzyme)
VRDGVGNADGQNRAGRAQEKQLLDQLAVVVSPDPGPERLAAWDRLVARTPNSDVAQLSVWGSIRRLAGYEPLYLLAVSGDIVLGGASVLRRTVRGLGRIGYLPYGPTVEPALDVARATVRERLADTLRAVSRSHAALFIQPPDGGEDIALELLRRGFRFSLAGIAPAATMRVDLTQSEEQLRANLARRVRTWTRRWPERGVKVRVGDERDIPVLAGLASVTAKYQGFAPFPVS